LGKGKRKRKNENEYPSEETSPWNQIINHEKVKLQQRFDMLCLLKQGFKVSNSHFEKVFGQRN
jgi:hypothetical protein